jgi:hypothetical protein
VNETQSALLKARYDNKQRHAHHKPAPAPLMLHLPEAAEALEAATVAWLLRSDAPALCVW